jgi:hypothetical protein
MEFENAVANDELLREIFGSQPDIFELQHTVVLQFGVIAVGRIALFAFKRDIGFDVAIEIEPFLRENLVDLRHVDFAFGLDVIRDIVKVGKTGVYKNRLAFEDE